MKILLVEPPPSPALPTSHCFTSTQLHLLDAYCLFCNSAMLAGLQRCYETQFVCFCVVVVVFLFALFESERSHAPTDSGRVAPGTAGGTCEPRTSCDPVHSHRLRGYGPGSATAPPGVLGYERLVRLLRFVAQRVNTKCDQSSEMRPDGPRMSSTAFGLLSCIIWTILNCLRLYNL